MDLRQGVSIGNIHIGPSSSSRHEQLNSNNCTLCRPHYVQCTLYNVQCTLYSVHCTLYSVCYTT